MCTNFFCMLPFLSRVEKIDVCSQSLVAFGLCYTICGVGRLHFEHRHAYHGEIHHHLFRPDVSCVCMLNDGMSSVDTINANNHTCVYRDPRDEDKQL